MRVLHRVGTPQRVGRGLAVGLFAAMAPIPGLRVVLSLLIATLVRGSRTVALTTQFLNLLIGIVPLVAAEFWIGRLFYRGAIATQADALALVHTIEEQWRWMHPINSSMEAWLNCQNAGPAVIGPLLIGVLALGGVAAAIGYPVGVICAVKFYVYRLRRNVRRGLSLHAPRGLLVLPSPTTDEAQISESAALRRYALRPQTYTRADRITLLLDGCQAYPEMLRAIAEAKESVALETYILRADKTGESFGRELAKAARRGVKVRLLYDFVGALGLPEKFIHELLAANVRVSTYRPLTTALGRSLFTFHRRDHRKILVVDDRVSFTGGINISHDNAAACDGGMAWRDMHVRIEGAAVAAQLKSLIDETWKTADAFPPISKVDAPSDEQPDEKFPPLLPATSSDVLVQVINNKEFLQRYRLRRAYLHAIRHARRYILIENAYFVPDRGVRRALYRAVKRGVTVSAGVAMYSDVKIVAMASRALYSEMLSHGVRLFEYPRSMLHSKVAVIDDAWAIVSSYNLDHRSLRHNLEAGVLIVNKPFAVAMRDQILKDITESREVTPEFHGARPWDEVLMESLAYQGRYWL